MKIGTEIPAYVLRDAILLRAVRAGDREKLELLANEKDLDLALLLAMAERQSRDIPMMRRATMIPVF